MSTKHPMLVFICKECRYRHQQ